MPYALTNAQTVAIINFTFRRIFRILIIFFLKYFFKTYSTPYRRQRLFGRGRIVRRTVIKELIDYNFPSNCHKDFKLGSYFSLWTAAPNMTLNFTIDLDLEKFTKDQNFWIISTKEN